MLKTQTFKSKQKWFKINLIEKNIYYSKPNWKFTTMKNIFKEKGFSIVKLASF